MSHEAQAQETTPVGVRCILEGLVSETLVWHGANMRDFRSLRSWHSAQQFVSSVYRATATFPSDERFGLSQQLRRAAVSIASNIAEGCGRDTKADLARFLTIATGSASECESQIETAARLGYLDGQTSSVLLSEVVSIRRQIHAYRVMILSD